MGTIISKKVNCGKPNCSTCANKEYHGPYFYYVEYDSRIRKHKWKYIGESVSNIQSYFFQRQYKVNSVNSINTDNSQIASVILYQLTPLFNKFPKNKAFKVAKYPSQVKKALNQLAKDLEKTNLSPRLQKKILAPKLQAWEIYFVSSYEKASQIIIEIDSDRLIFISESFDSPSALKGGPLFLTSDEALNPLILAEEQIHSQLKIWNAGFEEGAIQLIIIDSLRLANIKRYKNVESYYIEEKESVKFLIDLVFGEYGRHRLRQALEEENGWPSLDDEFKTAFQAMGLENEYDQYSKILQALININVIDDKEEWQAQRNNLLKDLREIQSVLAQFYRPE